MKKAIIDYVGNKGCLTFLKKGVLLQSLSNYQQYIRNVDPVLEQLLIEGYGLVFKLFLTKYIYNYDDDDDDGGDDYDDFQQLSMNSTMATLMMMMMMVMMMIVMMMMMMMMMLMMMMMMLMMVMMMVMMMMIVMNTSLIDYSI